MPGFFSFGRAGSARRSPDAELAAKVEQCKAHGQTDEMKFDDGPLKTEAWSVKEQGGKLTLEEVTLPPLKPSQVEIDMTHCGLCHTDIHMRDNDWGVANFPLVPGHEGVGVVRRVGSGCKTRKVGDIVGVGWIRDSCSACSACKIGKDNLCEKGYQGTFLGSNAGMWGKDPHNEYGGCFSKVMRIEERFAYSIPENIPPELAGPLMCGGGTIFEPIKDYVKPGSKVGVLGIGGLGTLAIKFSTLFGAHVTALSRTASKEAGAKKAGAKEFVVYTDKEAAAEVAGKLNVIIDCTCANADVAPFMDMLKFDGVLCRVGIPAANDNNCSFSYGWMPLIFTQKKIAGSIVTGSAHCNEMLEVAKNNKDFLLDDHATFTPEVMPFAQVNEAMDKLQSGKNQGYRIVLKW